MGAYIIAEAGVNHNGSLDIARQLCRAAKDVGADAIKFQTWKTEKLLTKRVGQAAYQADNTGRVESQYDMLKHLELSYDDFRALKHYCDELGIQFASTADEQESLDFLVSIGIPFIKVGSGDIGNISFLRYIGSKKLPVILSSGMSTLADVELSISALRRGGATEISLLHCTTSYPCPYASVNLKAMDTLKCAFGLPVGYSDHTLGIAIPIAAVVMGAVIIEKHFTLDMNMEGPDHRASTEPEEFKRMVNSIRNVELAMGTGIKQPNKDEIDIAEVVLKRIVAQREIPSGKIIEADDICVKRNDSGISAKYWDIMIGTKARRKYENDEAIEL
jgi:N-acetylneuraminate synthase/N,N'-diacetyllegionaminate synthase